MSTSFDFDNDSHRRFDPLRNTWALCSPHRTNRPWQGQQEKPSATTLPSYDPKCYLCPGNARAQGDLNPPYESTYVFENDFAAVKVDQPDFPLTKPNEKDIEAGDKSSLLLRAEGVRGKCYVICFHPAHNTTLAELPAQALLPVIAAWKSTYSSLARQAAQGEPFRYVQIFENKGATMGCSNPHPHGQVWCTDSIPTEPNTELANMAAYKNQHGACLLCDYAALESTAEGKPRVVVENDDWIVVCEWWATWPFQTLLLPKRHIPSLLDLTDDETASFADILARLTCRYDNLFETSFPYSMGIHQAPLKGKGEACEEDGCVIAHLHVHFYPPLLRSATVRKFLVGFEMMGEVQRDLTPEMAAARLRACDEVHYKRKQLE
ncbi:galactose-1-phosphate uridyl transferase [Saitoella coloradoensis]